MHTGGVVTCLHILHLCPLSPPSLSLSLSLSPLSPSLSLSLLTALPQYVIYIIAGVVAAIIAVFIIILIIICCCCVCKKKDSTDLNLGGNRKLVNKI